MIKKCMHCNADFSVIASRKDTAKFCSRACSDKAPREHNLVSCRECGKQFPLKKSQAKTVWGNFCSKACITAFRKRATLGEGNPNNKSRNFNQDGYRIYSPPAPLGLGLGKIKMHKAAVLVTLGLKSIPKGLHIHHRDCNVLNNDPSNLALLTASDHKWLHKQFGVATLAAYMRGDIATDLLASWSDDPSRALILLITSVDMQCEIIKRFPSADLFRICSMKPVALPIVEVTA